MDGPVLDCVRNSQRDRMCLRVELPVVILSITDSDFFRGRRNAIDSHRGAIPPGFVTGLFGAAGNRERGGGDSTGVVYAEKFALLVSERVAVILIKRAATVLTRINKQLQRPVRNFAGVLHNGLRRHDCAGSNVKRHLVERRMQLEFFLACMLSSRPKVVPLAGWKRNIFGINHLGSDGGNEQIAAEKKITIVIVKV